MDRKGWQKGSKEREEKGEEEWEGKGGRRGINGKKRNKRDGCEEKREEEWKGSGRKIAMYIKQKEEDKQDGWEGQERREKGKGDREGGGEGESTSVGPSLPKNTPAFFFFFPAGDRSNPRP